MKKIITYTKKAIIWTLSLTLLTFIVYASVWTWNTIEKGNHVVVENVTEALPIIEKCDADCQFDRMKKELVDEYYNANIETALRQAETTVKMRVRNEAELLALETIQKNITDDLQEYKGVAVSAAVE